MKVIAHSKNTPLKEKVLIAGDSISAKTGKNIELVSYHFDHKIGRSVLGNCYLPLGYHNGMNFHPIDVSLISSSNRPNARLRDIDKRTCGWKRRNEALDKQTTALVQMVDRGWHAGIDASFVLFDSWFAHDKIISSICDTGYGVICRLKRGRVKYGYQGEQYTIKQLWQKVAKKKTRWLSQHNVKGVCLKVTLRRLIGPIGPLFRQLADDQSMLMMAQLLWANVKEQIIRSSDVLCYKIEPDTLLHFFDIIEDTIIRQARITSANL